MRFIYRGVEHARNPDSVKLPEGEICGQYRGHHWNRHVIVESMHTRTDMPAKIPQCSLYDRGHNQRTGTDNGSY